MRLHTADNFEVSSDGLAAPGERRERIIALDGLRGLMTIFVVASHYFAEVPHGLRALGFGWIAVDMFFVLSGYLVGRLILEKGHHDNFLRVFYIRRICRTLPTYFLCLTVTLGLIALCDQAWSAAQHALPSWSYAVFLQNAVTAMTGNVGAHWLAPTWTLALEEHFYLVVPLFFAVVPQRLLVPALITVIASAVGYRAAIMLTSDASPLAALAVLPGRADSLALGLLAALAVRTGAFANERVNQVLRIVPMLLLIAVFGLLASLGDQSPAFVIFGHLLVSVGCAAFLLMLVHGAPEARRFQGTALRFWGHNSYAIYLTHLPVVGLMHGLLLGAEPDMADARQWLVTFAAIPICLVISRVLTRLVEEPITAYGRSWSWQSHPPSDARTIATVAT